MLIGDLNGYGCMPSYIPRLEKLIGGFCPRSIPKSLIKFQQTRAREFEECVNQEILLAVDRAGWHISHDLKVPEGLNLTLLPSDSPELKPAERLWTLVDEPIVNQSFETLDRWEEVLFHRCQSLLQQQDLIQGLTGFYWWIKIGA